MRIASGIARYVRTLRWLRPVQIYGRVWFRLHRPRPDLRPAPPLRAPTGRWQACARAASLTGPARLRALGVERELTDAPAWNRADWPRLWLYNAHYFDDLATPDAAARSAWQRALMARWIRENPPGTGVGWEPYPLSLRSVNWLKWAAAGNALPPAARESLAVQVRYLRRRLEYHLQGNHLWANAKALVFAGASHAGPEADGWLGAGLRLVERELAAQILPDGGHFELSPMYHAIVTEDLLDLLQLAALFPGPWADAARLARWRDAALRMLAWLGAMSHPDGCIAQFNDAALHLAPSAAALAGYAAALGLAPPAPAAAPLALLPESGYAVLRAGPAVLHADVGRIGQDHLPGHAHADTLSCELSLRDRRVLVNGGTSTYAAGPLRAWQRGTAAHNTVIVDGCDSSEVWGSFRVARRARPLPVTTRSTAAEQVLQGGHDGYRRLPGKLLHRREWRLTATSLQVRDRLEGRCTQALARYRFAPGWQLEASAPDAGTARAGADTLAWRASGVRAARIVAEAWYPDFGRRVPCQVLELVLGADGGNFELSWQA